MRRRVLIMQAKDIEGILVEVVLPVNYAVSHTFNYTGSELTFTPTIGHILKFLVWGAKGGWRTNSLSNGGVGGYAEGTLVVLKNETLYITVGECGNVAHGNATFGGGGYGSTYGLAGGGGSWVGISGNTNRGLLAYRFIVAGGGGSCGYINRPGGYGGGETGETRTENYGTGGEGGTQTAGGAGSSSDSNTAGTFGRGGNGIFHLDGYGGAGGGGWYGGAGVYPDSSSDDDRGGGGGSGYIYTAATSINSPGKSTLGTEYYISNGIFLTGSSVTGAPSTGHGKVVISDTYSSPESITTLENIKIKPLPNYWLKPVNPGSCYIPTDYIPTGEISKITGKVKLYPCDSTTTGIFGARKTKASNDRICCWLKENTIMVYYGSSGITHPTTYSAGDEIELPAFLRGSTSASMDTTMKLTIFAVNNGTEVDKRMSECYINKIIFWGDNDVKLHEYVPCQVTKQDGSSFYTLYDTVTKKTYVPVGEFTILKI